MPLRQYNEMVQAVPSDCANDPLRDRVGFGGSHGGQDRFDPEGRRFRHEVTAVVAIPVADQEARRRVPRSGGDDLPPDPGRRGVRGHVPMHDPASVVTDHEEDVERPQGKRLYGEEVGSPDFGGRQAQKGPPAGRRRRPDATITIDRRRTHGVPQHRQLGRDAPHAPGRILRPDPDDQAADDGIDARTTPRSSAALPTPVAPPRRPVPTDHGGGLHHLDMSTPPPPVPRSHGPEAPIRGRQRRAPSRALPDRQLLPQHQVL